MMTLKQKLKLTAWEIKLHMPQIRLHPSQRIAQYLESWPQKEKTAYSITVCKESQSTSCEKKCEKQYYTCRLSTGADSTKIEIFNLNSNTY